MLAEQIFLLAVHTMQALPSWVLLISVQATTTSDAI